MRMTWVSKWVFLALVLALLGPSAMAAKGGNKGGGNGGGNGGGEDPAPTCSGHIYALWQTFNGKSGPAGIARVCLEGADGEQLTDESLGWFDRLEVSPDGTYVAHNAWVAQLIELADPTNILSFTGESGALPAGGYPSWSWRVDASGEPLGALQQYVAVSRQDPIDIPEYDTTHLSMNLVAFHPMAGAQEFTLTSLPRSYEHTEASVLDQDSVQVVPGAVLNIVHTVVRDVTWLAGDPNAPDTSWVVFWQKTTDETWDVVGDASSFRAWSTSKQVEEGWSVMSVQTSSTGVSVLHAPQSLVSQSDVPFVDVRAGTRNLRVSKYGTHAWWEYAQDAGMSRAALVYSTTDPSEPPHIDVSTIEDIDPAIYTSLGSIPFANVGLSHDGSRLAIALGEVWTMDIDDGVSSLVQISETVRKRKPGYGISVAWDQ